MEGFNFYVDLYLEWALLLSKYSQTINIIMSFRVLTGIYNLVTDFLNQVVHKSKSLFMLNFLITTTILHEPLNIRELEMLSVSRADLPVLET